MEDLEKRQIASDILALYNRAKRIRKEKKYLYPMYKEVLGKNQKLLSVSWKSYSDFQKEIINFCHEIQPQKKDVSKRKDQELSDLGNGDIDLGEYFDNLYQFG